MADWTDVAPLDDFAVDSWKVVDVDDVMIAVFRLQDGFHAIEDACSHDYVCLTDGGELDGEEFICPRHGARFNVKSGEALTAPAYEAIETFPVQVENGMVQVRDPRWD